MGIIGERSALISVSVRGGDGDAEKSRRRGDFVWDCRRWQPDGVKTYSPARLGGTSIA